MLATEVHRRLISDRNWCQEWALWRWRFAQFGETGWQYMRAMYDLEASDGIRGPSWQEFHAVYSQTAVCGAFWIHRARILPKPAHFGYISAICCHEGAFFSVLDPFWNTSSENLTTVRRLGTHFANILPRLDDGKALGEYLAIVDQWRTHLGGDLAIVDQWRMRYEEIFPSLSTLRCALAEYSGSHRDL